MSEHHGRRGLPRAARVVVPLVLLSLAGCASIPTSGPVNTGRPLGLARGDDGVPVIGQPPAKGASQTDVVNGFLASSADFRNDHAVARLYLTAGARQRWRPQAGTTVYDKTTRVTTPVEGDRVTFGADEIGRIAADGGYRAARPGAPLEKSFRLVRESGQWRIAELDDGLLLSSAEADDTYRALSLYFLAPSGETLVPDVVLLPEQPGLTTKLVVRLLRGPTAELRGAVTTAFPDGTALQVNSVPVSPEGVATVSLDAGALRGTDNQTRERISAQLVWTLKQLSGIDAVHITAGGEDLAVSGVAAEQPISRWPLYNPDELPVAVSSYVALGGRIGRYVNDQFVAVRGEGGAETPRVREPAVSLDQQRLAAVSPGGRIVYVGGLTPGADLERRLSGRDFAAPSWDRGRNLWAVDRADGRLLYLADGADEPQVQVVQVPGLAGLERDEGAAPGDLRPQGVSISRDGARAALVVGTGRGARLLVGAINRQETADTTVKGGELLSVLNVTEVLPSLRGVRDVAWADATHLAVLGSIQGASLRPYLLAVDGYSWSDVAPVPGADPVTIATAPPLRSADVPIVVGAAPARFGQPGSILQFTSGDTWEQVGPGADPAYPG
jgi:hypothetical protein